MSGPPAKPEGSFGGILIMAVGALMVIFCGGCGGVWLLAASDMTFSAGFNPVSAPANGGATATIAPLLAIAATIVGGAPALAGGTLFFMGLRARLGGLPRPVGWAVAGFGALLAAFSLVCLAVGLGADLRWRPQDAKDAGSLAAVLIPFLICWGAPAAGGALIVHLGLRMARKEPAPAA